MVRRIGKRREYNYGKRNKKPAKKGIAGFLIGVVGVLALAAILFLSAKKGGNLETIMGALAIALFGVGALGLYVALLSFHEIDKNYSLSRAAVVINAVLMSVIFIIFVIGVR